MLGHIHTYILICIYVYIYIYIYIYNIVVHMSDCLTIHTYIHTQAHRHAIMKTHMSMFKTLLFAVMLFPLHTLSFNKHLLLYEHEDWLTHHVHVYIRIMPQIRHCIGVFEQFHACVYMCVYLRMPNDTFICMCEHTVWMYCNAFM